MGRLQATFDDFFTSLQHPAIFQGDTFQGATNDFPLASLPSTQKMVRMLGPETAVMIPDSDGLLLDSRGKIPFSTKMVLGAPITGGGFFFLMMMMAR